MARAVAHLPTLTLTLRVPVLYGVRIRIAAALVWLAAKLGHMNVEFDIGDPSAKQQTIDAMVQARAVLITCAAEPSDDLARPGVIARRIQRLTAAIEALKA